MSIRTEAGQGGRKGHSNMSHWEKTEFVKARASRSRRTADRLAVREVEDDTELATPAPVAEEPEAECYCRRCYLHDDPGGCVAQ